MPTAEPSTPPPEVRALAADEDLGRLLAVLRPAVHLRVLLPCLAVELLPIVLLFRAPLVGLATGVLVSPAEIWFLRRRPVVVGLRRRIYLYDKALIHASAGGRLDCFRFDQITTVFQRVDRRRFGAKAIQALQVRATRTDGKTIRVSDAWVGGVQAARQVIDRVRLAQLPAARAALRRGASVHFGRLVVDADGVTGPSGSAQWSGVDLTSSHGGMIAMTASDEFLPLFHAKAWRIPNLQLLVQLHHDYRKALP